jgi:hypothetical protein
MKTIAIAAGALLASIATTASAQVYYERTYTYDPYWGARAEFRDARDECWNPRAGHFEAVRPGEIQNDLDFARCRPIGSGRYFERRMYRDSYEECWNPRAGHFEAVRPGERQYDLDFSRCRLVR